MAHTFEALAQLLYDECINWIVDYIEKEVDFQTVLNKFETTKSKLNHDQLDLEDLLDDEQYETLLDINSLLEHRVITVHDATIDTPLSESSLREKLTEIVDQIKQSAIE